MTTYLGDGLYVEDEGDMVTFYTERSNGRHFVCLEDEVLSAFFRFLERSRNLKITIEPKAKWNLEMNEEKIRGEIERGEHREEE